MKENPQVRTSQRAFSGDPFGLADCCSWGMGPLRELGPSHQYFQLLARCQEKPQDRLRKPPRPSDAELILSFVSGSVQQAAYTIQIFFELRFATQSHHSHPKRIEP